MVHITVYYNHFPFVNRNITKKHIFFCRAIAYTIDTTRDYGIRQEALF